MKGIVIRFCFCLLFSAVAGQSLQAQCESIFFASQAPMFVQCTLGNSSCLITVTQANPGDIYLINLNNSGDTVLATVNCADSSFSIPMQPFTGGTINGTGDYFGGFVVVDFLISGPSGSNQCSNGYTPDGLTGQPELVDGNRFYLFPNPAAGDFYVRAERDGKINYKLIDITGRVCGSGSFEGGTDCRIPAGDLLPGVYFLRAEGTDGARLNKRVVIQ